MGVLIAFRLTCAAELTWTLLSLQLAGGKQSVHAFDDVQTGGRRVERVVSLLQQWQQTLNLRISRVAVSTARRVRAPFQTESGHDLSLDHEQSRLLVSATQSDSGVGLSTVQHRAKNAIKILKI